MIMSMWCFWKLAAHLPVRMVLNAHVPALCEHRLGTGVLAAHTRFSATIDT